MKFPKPFFRSGRGWYVQIGKQQIKLADGPENPDTEAAALTRYHEVMAEHGRGAPFPTSPPAVGPSVGEALEKYLDWCQKHRAAKTYSWYKDHLQSFADALPSAAVMPVADLKPFHVIEWVDKHPDWSSTTKRGAIGAVQRAFRFAEELGYIDKSPVRRIQKPAPQRRDNPMTPEDFALVLSKVREKDPFRDLLEFTWHSGCRPQEARHIEPRHVHLDAECVVFPKEEAKGRKRPRIILLHGRALEIIRRLMAIRSEGKLFLNRAGRPWKKYAICCRFWRLKKKLGKKFALYDARHGFCQRLLEKGVNHMAVAELLGHANGQMVSTVYSHMNRATSHLKEALRKASGESI